MKKRIFNSVFFVSLAVTLCCAVLFTGVLYGYFSRTHNLEIQNEAAYIAQGYADRGIAYLDAVKNANVNTRITLIAQDGTVLYDSAAESAAMENHLDREEIKEAFAGGKGESFRYSKTLAEKNYYYALLLADGTVLRVSNVSFSALSIVWSMLQPVLLVTVATCILSLILASAIARHTLKPINEIDLENPDDTHIAEELTPLIKKIRSQNLQIRSQMEKLKRSQQEFKMITENMAEGLIIVDSHTDVLSYNQSAARIFNTDTIKEKESAFVLNRSAPFRSAVKNALAGRHGTQMLTLQGRIYNLLFNPVIYDKTVKGAVVVILDVTEKEEREKLRREFAANVSHELKTPLTSISGFAEIIMNGIAKSEDIPHFAENIYKESARLVTLVGDIIKISQLDEGAIEAKKETVQLLPTAQKAAGALTAAATEKGVHISVCGDNSEVYGVSSILDEMIFNLCDNAVKYNRKNGKVDIVVQNNAITVRDTGIGIPKAEQERIFERFYRVDKSHSKAIGGTGLGLSIVKHGALYHKASICLESTPDIGTSITIQF